MTGEPAAAPRRATGGATSPGSGLKPETLKRARLALLWEALWPALWPPLGIAGLFAALALLGLIALRPEWLHLLILIGFLLVFAGALWRLARALRLPSIAAAERRIERDNALQHRPLAALDDTLAVGEGDPFTEALWRAHLVRMLKALGRIKVALPRPGLPRRDPLALRLLLVLLLALGLVTAGRDAPRRLVAAILPGLGALTPRLPATAEIWLTPPAYTGLAPIFLRAGKEGSSGAAGVAPGNAARPVKVPVNSQVLARLEGGSGNPQLVIGEKQVPFKPVDNSTYQLESKIESGERLAIRQQGRTLAEWAISIVPVLPPKVRFTAPPLGTLRGALRLEYAASDAYGVASVKALIKRRGAPASETPIELELPLSGGHPKEAHETSFSDLTPHPWAGLPVTIELRAENEAGLAGTSQPFPTILPERTFNHPVARAIIVNRRLLAEDPERRGEVADELTGIAAHPGAFGGDIGVFLSLIAARSELAESGRPETIAAVEQLLWDTALAVEEGHLSLAERELRELQQKLMDALDRNAPDKEIEQLIAQLEDAIEHYLQALADEQLRNPSQAQKSERNSQLVERQDLERLLDRMREMARTGARDSARQLLAQLQDMLENMRAARMNPNGQGQNSASALMRGLDELIGQQDRLMQQTFRDAQQGGIGMPLGVPGSGKGAAEQEVLRKALGDIMRRLGDMSGRIPGELGRAERAMRDAVDALNRSVPGDAVGAQTQALEALRRGRQAMLDGLRDRLGQEGDSDDLDAFGPSRDPLGRVMPGFGAFDGNDVAIPEHGELQRAREIQDELQRRAGERQRPELEREYIERLLKRF